MKAILADSFHKPAAYMVVELVHGNQYMVTQRKGNMMNITTKAQGQNIESGKMEVNKSEVGNEMQSRAKTNVLTIADKCCSCGKWQEYKYPCMHAMAYPWKWEQLAFPTILQYHVHTIISLKDCNKSMITISSQLYKINLVLL